MFSDASASSLRWPEGTRAAVAVPVVVAATAIPWPCGASFWPDAPGTRVVAPLVVPAPTLAGSAQLAAGSILGGTWTGVAAAVLLTARSAPVLIAAASRFRGLRLRRRAETQLIARLS